MFATRPAQKTLLWLAALACLPAANAGNLAAPWATVTPIYMGSAIQMNLIAATRRSMDARTPDAATAASGGSASRGGTADFSVGRSAQVSAQTLAEFSQSIRSNYEPQTAASILETFARKPVRAAYREASSPYGLGDGDLRDVLAAYLVTTWMVANQAPLPAVASVQAVRRQLGAVASAAGNSAAERQTAAEQMMYELVCLIYARQEGEQTHNRQALQTMANATAQALRKRGFDPLRMSLTPAGFQPR